MAFHLPTHWGIKRFINLSDIPISRLAEIVPPNGLKWLTTSITERDVLRLVKSSGSLSLRKERRSSLVLLTFKRMLLRSVQLLIMSLFICSDVFEDDLETILKTVQSSTYWSTGRSVNKSFIITKSVAQVFFPEEYQRWLISKTTFVGQVLHVRSGYANSHSRSLIIYGVCPAVVVCEEGCYGLCGQMLLGNLSCMLW